MDANSEGAGIGNFNNENTTPAINPVVRDLIRSIKSICICLATFFLLTNMSFTVQK